MIEIKCGVEYVCMEKSCDLDYINDKYLYGLL